MAAAGNDIPPEHLYKYRSLTGEQREFTRDIIVNRRLWCGSAGSLNDPYDCYPVPHLPGNATMKNIRVRSMLRRTNPSLPRSQIKLVAENVLANPADLNDLMQGAVDQIRAEIGVLSLSASGAISEMWQGYCHDHQGVCLRFQDPEDQPPMFSLARQVHYVSERPTVEAVDRPTEAFRRRFLLTKTDKWAYEQEWRLVDPIKTGAVWFPPAALNGVIFGAAISEEDRATVMEWLGGAGGNVELMQACLANGDVTIAPYAG